MTPQARIASTIEILSDFLTAKQPADNCLSSYLKSRRFIGSKDRRFISDFFWKIIRNLSKICFYIHLDLENIVSADARKMVISALKFIEKKTNEEIIELFNGLNYAPEKLNNEELKLLKADASPNDIPEHIKLEMPLWLYRKIHQHFKEKTTSELTTLLEDAKPVLRVNTIKINVNDYMALLDEKQINYQKSPLAPLGIILEKRLNPSEIPGFKDGLVEFQDEASQLASLVSGAKKGNKVLDFCAGAGGKSLAIASQMHNIGKIFATDIAKSKLENINQRITRSGATIITPLHFKDYSDLPSYFKNHFDVVFVDSPCSGTGTFRRSPDAKWRLSEDYIKELNNIQKEVLFEAAKMVNPKGTLIYVTCSILPDENETIVNNFLETNPDFYLVNANEILLKITNNDAFINKALFLQLTPFKNQTDGFFVAVMKKHEKQTHAPS